MEAALPIPFAEGIVDWRQHGLDPLEPVVHRARWQVQIVLFQLPQ